MYDPVLSDEISIHALRKESDSLFTVVYYFSGYFNPRSP